MKKLLCILILLSVLLLTSCGGTATEPAQTTEAETAPTVSAEDAGFTLEDVLARNSVTTLVSAYGSVQVMRYENDALYAESSYFMYAGKLVSTCCTQNPDGENDYSCSVDNVVYRKEGDHLQFSCALEPGELPDDYNVDVDVTAQILEGTIQKYEEPDEDTWLFEIRDAEQAQELVCRCTVAKKSLTLKQIDWKYGDGSTTKIVVVCGDDAQAKEFGLLDGFAKPMRTVKCICTLHDKSGKPSEKTISVEVPYNAEPLWVTSREVNVYMDKGLTKPYKYPGNGEDGYTVYVTDAMG